jgi:excisionase family DNA binding protein
LVSRSRGAAAGLERLLTVLEVAAVVGVATSTVYQLCAAGKLAHVRVSNAIRIERTKLALFVARMHRAKGTRDEALAPGPC